MRSLRVTRIVNREGVEFAFLRFVEHPSRVSEVWPKDEPPADPEKLLAELEGILESLTASIAEREETPN